MKYRRTALLPMFGFLPSNISRITTRISLWRYEILPVRLRPGPFSGADLGMGRKSWIGSDICNFYQRTPEGSNALLTKQGQPKKRRKR